MSNYLTAEEQDTWNSIKNGLPNNKNTGVIFGGDGVATKFNSAWISGSDIIRLTIDDVVQSAFKDYSVSNNDIIFNEAPANGSLIEVGLAH